MDTEDRRMDYLVIIETQKTKQYLFASPYLRETRGGSVLLDLLNRKETEELLRNNYPNSSYEIVYLGGGSGKVLFSNKDHAEQFKQQLIQLYRTKIVLCCLWLDCLGPAPFPI